MKKPGPGRPEIPTGAGARHSPTMAGSHEVRIIGGQWKRSKLQVLDRPGMRPTPDRVRETLFNWLGQDLTGWRCLDLFAGSGALGFEAASRGAADAVLLERDTALVRQLRTAQERLKAATVRIEQVDAFVWIKRALPGSFDLIFIDPPFDAGDFEKALAAALRLLAPGGTVYLEAPVEFSDAMLSPLGYDLVRAGRAGAVHFHLLQRRAPQTATHQPATPTAEETAP